MKALYFKSHGNLDVITFGDVPDPSTGDKEVLIRVRACALNHLDIWVRRGWPGLNLEMPHWCGADVAGEIAALGKNVAGWEIGQRVIVDPGISSTADRFTRSGLDSLSPGYRILGEHVRGGTAEYLSVPAGNLMAMPDALDFPEAAAPLLVALTAWRMLIRQAALRAGESVLVVGAGGGVNSMAVQIAKLAGAVVYVVAGNAAKADLARKLGADEVIDRSQTDWGREIYRLTGKQGVDVVVDNVGRATMPTSMQAVCRGGRIVIVGNTSGPKTNIDLRFVFGKQIRLIGSTMGSHQDFRKVTALLHCGRLTPVIHRIMPLEEGKAAYAIIKKGEQFGKLVLTP